MTEKMEIVGIIRESSKAFLCVDSHGNEAWIKKEKLPEDGMYNAKSWIKKVNWFNQVKEKKGR